MTHTRSGISPTLRDARQPTFSAPSRELRNAAVLFLGTFLLHNADHLRRGLAAVTPEVLWAGTLSALLTLAAIALTLLGHRVAPLLAVAIGFSMALGVSIVHLLPRWSVLSDSLPDGNVDLLSWVAVLSEIGGALVFGWAGLRHPRQVAQATER